MCKREVVFFTRVGVFLGEGNFLRNKHTQRILIFAPVSREFVFCLKKGVKEKVFFQVRECC